jgi:hypothetical protein
MADLHGRGIERTYPSRVRARWGVRGGLLVGGLLAGLLLAGCTGGSSNAGAASGTAGSARTSVTSAGSSTTTGATVGPTRTPTSRPPTSRPNVTVTAGVPGSTSSLVPWDEPSIKVGGSGPTPSAASGGADLTILLDDGFGVRAYWTLTCDPVGGSHPQARTACGVLGANGAKALPAGTRDDCAVEYGGPQKARVTGTWRGRPVDSQFTLENGCEITRWTAMSGFLPPGGV